MVLFKTLPNKTECDTRDKDLNTDASPEPERRPEDDGYIHGNAGYFARVPRGTCADRKSRYTLQRPSDTLEEQQEFTDSF